MVGFILLWIVAPLIAAGVSTYLVISGLRASNRTRLFIGYGILLAIVLVAGIAASISESSGIFELVFVAKIVLPLALVGGSICAGIVEKWQKLHGILIGILFPVMLFGSTVVGLQFSPDPFEQQYLKYTEGILDDIQNGESTIISYEYKRRCFLYLKNSLTQYVGQYSLSVLMVTDPGNDPQGKTWAALLVEFPGGGQVEIHYFDYYLTYCEIVDDE